MIPTESLDSDSSYDSISRQGGSPTGNTGHIENLAGNTEDAAVPADSPKVIAQANSKSSCSFGAYQGFSTV